MSVNSNDPKPTAENGPLQDFSNCHVGILKNCERLQRLPALLSQPDGAAEARQIAAEMQRFFHEVVLEHHAEEEEELFSAVMRSAAPGEEARQAKAMIDRLVIEHRLLETLWKLIEPDVKRLAKGKPSNLNEAAVTRLAQDYPAHARFEETEFLPLSARILSKNDQAALGLSLHMRHSGKTVYGYI
jgi:hypothetical protein